MAHTGECTSVFIGESRDGYIKLTTDRDCLSCEIIRFDERIVPLDILDQRLTECATAYRERGFHVCIDTLTRFEELEPIKPLRKLTRYDEPPNENAGPARVLTASDIERIGKHATRNGSPINRNPSRRHA